MGLNSFEILRLRLSCKQAPNIRDFITSALPLLSASRPCVYIRFPSSAPPPIRTAPFSSSTACAQILIQKSKTIINNKRLHQSPSVLPVCQKQWAHSEIIVSHLCGRLVGDEGKQRALCTCYSACRTLPGRGRAGTGIVGCKRFYFTLLWNGWSVKACVRY